MIAQPPFHCPPLASRGGDRRQSTRLESPPYLTPNGLVAIDRRSYLERRACWIRDFKVELAEIR